MEFLKFFFLLSGILHAADVPFKTRLKNTLKKLEKNLKSNKDFIPSLNILNDETKSFLGSINPKVLATESLYYILAKERAVQLFSIYDDNPYLKENEPSMIEFIKNLLQDIKDNQQLFTNIQEILNFVLAYLTLENGQSFSAALASFLERLTFDEISGILSYPKRSVLGKLFIKSIVETEINVLDSTEPQDPDKIIFLLKHCNNTPVNNDKLIKLLGMLRFIDFNSRHDLLHPALNTLQVISIGKTKNIAFSKALLNALCFDQMLYIILEVPEEYKDLIYQLYLAYTNPELKSNESEISSKIYEFYDNAFQVFTNISVEVEKIKVLKTRKTESTIIAALDAVKRLKNMTKNDPKYVRAIQFSLDPIEDSINSLVPMLSDYNRHPLQAISWKYCVQLGFLQYDVLVGKYGKPEAFSNLMLAIGTLLKMGEKENYLYPSEEIDEFLPIIDEALEGYKMVFEDRRDPPDSKTVKIYSIVINLHPDQAARDSYTDRLLSMYISTFGDKYNNFTELAEFYPTDKRGVILTAFSTFVEDYEKDPQRIKLRYLRKFYLFIQSSGLLSKTEEKLFEAKYRSFRN